MLLRVQELGCFEEMPVESVSTAVIEEMFMVPKPDLKKLKTVHNMKRSNASSHKIHFKMEGLRDVKDMVRPGDFMTKWTLRMLTFISSGSVCTESMLVSDGKASSGSGSA